MGWWQNIQNDIGGQAQESQGVGSDTPPNLNWGGSNLGIGSGQVINQTAQYVDNLQPNVGGWFGNIQQSYQQIEQQQPQYNQPDNLNWPDEQQQARPQYNNPFDTFNQVVSNAAQGASGANRNVDDGAQYNLPNATDDNDYFGNIYRAIRTPAEQNAYENNRKDKMPWDVVAEGIGNVAEGLLGGLGQAVRPVGGVVDTIADSGVPGASQYAQGVRGFYENVDEPIFNFTSSIVGDISRGQGLNFLNNLNPFNAADRDKTVAAKLGYVQDAYNNAISSGLTEEQATQLAQNLDRKLGNFANLTEYAGIQKFGTLPALAQLGIGLLDPVGNLGGEALLAGKLPRGLVEGGISRLPIGEARTVGDVARTAEKGLQYAAPFPLAGKALGGISDVTGLSGALDRAGEALQSGKLQLANYDVASTTPIQALDNFVKASADTPQRITGWEAIRQFLQDPDSPVYYTKVGGTPEVVASIQKAFDALPPEKVGTDYVLTPEQQKIGQTKAEFGYNTQDTNATIPFEDIGKNNPSGSYIGTHDLPNLEAAYDKAYAEFQDEVRKAQVKDPDYAFKSDEETIRENPDWGKALARREEALKTYMDAKQIAEDRWDKPVGRAEELFGPPVDPKTIADNAALDKDFNANFNNEITPKTPLPEKYAGVTLPGKDATVSEFFGSGRQILGIDKGAIGRDIAKSTVGKPVLRELRPLEQMGSVGRVAQGLNDATNAVFARPFLNTFSRMVRDPLSNYSKLALTDPAGLVRYIASKVGVDDGVTSRFEQLTGNKLAPEVGAPSLAADVEKFGKGADNPVATLWYFMSNPQNEIPAAILRKVTKGKFTDPTDFINKSESKIKDFKYKRDFLRTYDNLVDESVRRGGFADMVGTGAGKVTEAQLSDFLKGKMPLGADIGDYISKNYNPANLSDTVRALPKMADVLGGKAGPAGDAINMALNSIKSEVDAENALRAARVAKEENIIKNRVTNPAEKARRLDALNKPPYSPIDLSDINPSSEIFTKIETAFNKELDRIFATQSVAAASDPVVLQAHRDAFKAAITYAKRNGDLSAFRQTLESEILSREAAYAAKYQAAAPPQVAQGLQERALEWATNRYKKNDRTGVTESSALDALGKSDMGRGIQLSQIKKWVNDEPLPKSLQGKRLMYEEGKGTYWMSPTHKLYDKANEVPAGVQPKAQSAPQLDFKALYDRILKRNVAKGDGFYSAEQARRQVNDGNYAYAANALIKVDGQIRQVTNNLFKLDFDTLTPIGRKGTANEGEYLTELAKHGKPYDTVKPIFPPKLPAEVGSMQLPDMLKAVEQHYGKDAYKDFSTMTQPEFDARVNELAESILGVKPIDPLAPMTKGLLEREEAGKLWEAVKKDIADRYNEERLGKIQHQQAIGQAQLDQTAIANRLKSEQNRIVTQAHQAGYTGVKDTYFDYRNKNKVDALLGSVLPFQYWARQNFAFVARHLAQHPMHYAALLNFYKQLEEENSDPNIPDYAKGDIFLWQNPDGSKVMWDFSSLFPFNPFGSSDSVMQVVSPGDSTGRSVRNTDPLAILMGTDIKSATTGKVTGRDKGILSSFLRPNPVLELAFKTGNVNNLLTSLGLAQGDQTTLGQDYPDATRAQKETSGLIPGNSFYQEIGAATGLTKALRGTGAVKGDLSPQSVLDEALFGLNAGKPQTKILQELTSMAQKGDISADQAKLAIAAYKEGNWTPEALKALDLVQGENAPRRLLTNMGFTSIVLNTPRQQVTNKLYEGLDKAYDGSKAKTITGSDGKKIYVPSDASKYYSDNPGASVLTSANDTSNDIRQGISDDKTRQAYASLIQKSQSKAITARDYNVELAKLEASNPQYFIDHPIKGDSPEQRKYYEDLESYKKIGGDRYDELAKRAYDLSQSGDRDGASKIYNSLDYKNAKAAREQFMSDNQSFKTAYVGYLKSKGQDYKEPDPKEQKYFDELAAYQAIGGPKYDAKAKAVSDAYASGNTKLGGQLYKDPEYLKYKTAREVYLEDHPEFKTQYEAYNKEKYGTPTSADKAATTGGTSSAGGVSSSYSGNSIRTTSGSASTSTARKSTYVPYTQYKAQQAATTKLPASNAAGKTTNAVTQSKSEVAALTAKKPVGTVGKVANVPTATAEDLTTRGWEGTMFPADFGREDTSVWKYSGEAVQDAQKLMAQDDSIVAVAVYSTDLKGYFVYTKNKDELTNSDISLINSQNKRIGLPPTTLTAKPKDTAVPSSSTNSSLTKTINSGKMINNSNSSLPYNLGRLVAAGKPSTSSSTARRSGGGGSRSTRLPGPQVSYSPGVSFKRPVRVT